MGFHHQKWYFFWHLMGCADNDDKNLLFSQQLSHDWGSYWEYVLSKSKELCLMVPLDYDGVADATVRLMVSDSSKNGTWVNEQRLAKERFEELKDGHVLRIADVARYVP